MESKSSLQSSQKSTTVSCPELDRSNPGHHILFLPVVAYFSQLFSFLQVFRLTVFSGPPCVLHAPPTSSRLKMSTFRLTWYMLLWLQPVDRELTLAISLALVAWLGFHLALTLQRICTSCLTSSVSAITQSVTCTSLSTGCSVQAANTAASLNVIRTQICAWCVCKHHVTHTDREVKVQCQALTFKLHGGWWLASRPSRFIPEQRIPLATT
jgi:hypothetical protein